MLILDVNKFPVYEEVFFLSGKTLCDLNVCKALKSQLHFPTCN